MPVAAPAPAPALPPAASLPGCPTPLQALQAAGEFDLLAQLIATTSLGGPSLVSRVQGQTWGALLYEG